MDLSQKKFNLEDILSAMIKYISNSLGPTEFLSLLESDTPRVLSLPDDIPTLKSLEKKNRKELEDLFIETLELIDEIIIFVETDEQFKENIHIKDRHHGIKQNLMSLSMNFRNIPRIEIYRLKKGEKSTKKDQIRDYREVYILNLALIEDLTILSGIFKELRKEADVFRIAKNHQLIQRSLKQLNNVLKTFLEIQKQTRPHFLTHQDAKIERTIFDQFRGKRSLDQALIDQIEKAVLERINFYQSSDRTKVFLSELYTDLLSYEEELFFTSDSLEKALNQMKSKGLIIGLKTFDNNLKVVELFTPPLEEDEITVIQNASEKGSLTLADLKLKTNWDNERIRRTLNSLVKVKIMRYVSKRSEGERWYLIL